MIQKRITLVGAPVDRGAGTLGCGMGPASFRLAGIEPILIELGHIVSDCGDVKPDWVADPGLPGCARDAQNLAGWTRALENVTYDILSRGEFPVALGGDHALAMGTVAGAAKYANEQNRPLCVLWLDAHADFNTPMTSPSGNMHGMPMAFSCGEAGFDGLLPSSRPVIDPTNVFMLGIRSIDSQERDLLAKRGVNVFDMRAIDEFGVAVIVRHVLAQVKERNGLLHVSLDVDFLDPAIAPGVGTPVSGGANEREAHLIMEMLHDSDLTTSMDLVELNTFLDDRGRSAKLLVDLTASLFGRTVYPSGLPLRFMERLDHVA